MSSKIAVQLYSLRNELTEDFEGTIAKIASIGYDGVEFAGCPPGMSLEECCGIVKNAGLIVSSALFPLPVGVDKDLIIENAKTLGSNYIISGKGAADFKSADLIKKACDEFNLAAQTAKENGLKFGIHNHWWEFEDVDGVPAYKIMLEHLSDDVLLELDTYWIKIAGKDPAGVLKEIGRRAPLVHIKDGTGIKDDFNMKAAGQGIMDFKLIFENTKNKEWLICELDDCETDMLQAVKESYIYISENK
jgi:sugar phosphate isomerase/epimerase